MVDRYAKFATEHLTVAAASIARQRDKNVIEIVTFLSLQGVQAGDLLKLTYLVGLVGRAGLEPATNGLKVQRPVFSLGSITYIRC